MSMENIAGARKPAKREDEHTVAGEHRMMRRADREVTNPEQIAAIVAACDIVEVAYADAEGLTIVPLNFGFDYDEATGKLTLWFHSAPRGRKLDAIRAAAGGRLPVAFTMQTDCEVVAGRTTCNWGEAFKSIVGNGTASPVEDLDECRHGLQTLMAQQAHMPNVEFTDAQVRSVTVWKIESDYFTTKVRTKPVPRESAAAATTSRCAATPPPVKPS
ncbi:flavin-nucleotide-binding protein [Bifidobacterium longum]|uniref:pyridoxamine 5'-phosphate oxidase family protein n=1 Tax=Bifidobacterium longum TaxID=216816 RepID=UPI0009B9FA19|nr:pyridoxamine 5'-phosphate oxidase family protein [Bifidobacterium longum]OQM59565.1 flavin-nucleotide-binding protein [Bifidobacterium longum]